MKLLTYVDVNAIKSRCKVKAKIVVYSDFIFLSEIDIVYSIVMETNLHGFHYLNDLYQFLSNGLKRIGVTYSSAAKTESSVSAAGVGLDWMAACGPNGKILVTFCTASSTFLLISRTFATWSAMLALMVSAVLFTTFRALSTDLCAFVWNVFSKFPMIPGSA